MPFSFTLCGSRSSALPSCFAAFLFLASALRVVSASWAPVDPIDLASTASENPAGSDLEVLLSEHVLQYVDRDRWLSNHVRAKVYTQAGVQRSSLLRFEYSVATRVRNVAARVVKPNGATHEVTKDQIFTESLLKGKDVHLKSTSFAFPNLVPGDVVEYRWEQLVSDDSFYTHHCQLAVPIRDFVFHVKDLPGGYQVTSFHCPGAKLTKGSRNSVQLKMQNLAPFEEEPLMPPERDLRAWIAVVFNHPFLKFGRDDNIWQYIGKYLADVFAQNTRPDDALKKRAEELTQGIADEEKQIESIYRYCQETISNFDWFKSPELLAAREKREKREDAPDARTILALGAGDSEDVNCVFASLARAAGFEVRYALNASRNEIMNIRPSKGWLFVDRRSVAVHVNGSWKIYSPGNYLLACGMRDPRDEAVTVFVADTKKSWFEELPVSPAAASSIRRKARFSITPDGTLVGEVEESWWGGPAIGLKNDSWGESAVHATNTFKARLAKRLPMAEVTTSEWDNLGNNAYPVVHRYKVNVPGYAETAGSRLLLTVNFFEAGRLPFFVSDKRSHAIYLPFAWTEQDEMEFIVPDGFRFDWSSTPDDVTDNGGLITARYAIKYWPDKSTVTYQREHVVGGPGAIAFEQRSYGVIKRLLDQIHEADGHRISFKSISP